MAPGKLPSSWWGDLLFLTFDDAEIGEQHMEEINITIDGQEFSGNKGMTILSAIAENSF